MYSTNYAVVYKNRAVVYKNRAVVYKNRAVVFTNCVAVYSLDAGKRKYVPASSEVCASIPGGLRKEEGARRLATRK